jgi:POT family
MPFTLGKRKSSFAHTGSAPLLLGDSFVLSNGEAGSLHGVPQKYWHDEPHSSSSSAKPSVLLRVTSFIVVCELCERLAYYSVAGSLVLFLQRNLNMSNAAADQQYSLWSGVCYITPLLGGWAADAHLGRYRAILIFSCIYLVGLLLTAYGAIPNDNSAVSPAPLVLTGIYIIAVGTGGIKPCVSTFGADQFDDSNPQDQKVSVTCQRITVNTVKLYYIKSNYQLYSIPLMLFRLLLFCMSNATGESKLFQLVLLCSQLWCIDKLYSC